MALAGHRERPMVRRSRGAAQMKDPQESWAFAVVLGKRPLVSQLVPKIGKQT